MSTREAMALAETVQAEAWRSAKTLEMPTRPAPVSPTASTLPPTKPSDVVVFPGERIATLADIIRLRVLSERIDFLALLEGEGLTAAYYARMCARFDVLRRSDPRLDQAYRSRVELARSSTKTSVG